MGYEVITGDCRDVMRGMDADSIDSIVTDPPYGLSFMGKGWDKGVPGEEFWVEALRVAKPGAHLLAFGGTRMVHRLAVAIEDAGWDIRDRIHWVYGSGFPKSHNISKAIDKAAGYDGVQGPMKRGGERLAMLKDGKRDGQGKWGDEVGRNPYTTIPESDQAQQWDGWGTALKPAVEPIILARKPFKGTVAANVLEWGTGGVNVDGCRVGTTDTYSYPNGPGGNTFTVAGGVDGSRKKPTENNPSGRFPANLIHDGSDDATAGMGDASRYFYCAKASKKDRDEGNNHPTVKPTDLMAYLCRLVTPPQGTVLDPFNGSGSTGKAAVREGFNYIGIELDNEYADIARQRIAAAQTQGVA